ncbi:NAD-dependent epimerase/dehydratase family protein, partial [Mycobacterium tuberculosis]
RFHEAVESRVDKVAIWGTGTPRREFLHVDDMAEASLFVFELPVERYRANTEPMLSHINVGYGEDVTIADLARLIAQVTGFDGEIVFDTTKPDGTMRKLMDSSRIEAMGWKPSVTLADGVR